MVEEGSMIQDARECVVTLDAIAEFEKALEQLDGIPQNSPDLNPRERLLLRESMEGELAALRAQIEDYVTRQHMYST